MSGLFYAQKYFIVNRLAKGHNLIAVIAGSILACLIAIFVIAFHCLIFLLLVFGNEKMKLSLPRMFIEFSNILNPKIKDVAVVFPRGFI